MPVTELPPADDIFERLHRVQPDACILDCKFSRDMAAETTVRPWSPRYIATGEITSCQPEEAISQQADSRLAAAAAVSLKVGQLEFVFFAQHLNCQTSKA